MGIHNSARALWIWKANLLAKQWSADMSSWFFFGRFCWRAEFLWSFKQSSFNLYLRKLEAALSAIQLFYSTYPRTASTAEVLVEDAGEWRALERPALGVLTVLSEVPGLGGVWGLLLSVKARLDWSSTGLAKQRIIAEEGFQYVAHHLSNGNLIVIRNASFPGQVYQKSLVCLLWLIPYFQWRSKGRL